jgi:hypothetical protein
MTDLAFDDASRTADRTGHSGLRLGEAGLASLAGAAFAALALAAATSWMVAAALQGFVHLLSGF